MRNIKYKNHDDRQSNIKTITAFFFAYYFLSSCITLGYALNPHKCMFVIVLIIINGVFIYILYTKYVKKIIYT